MSTPETIDNKIARLTAENAQLREEVAALRKDAELLNAAEGMHVEAHESQGEHSGSWATWAFTGPTLRTAIAKGAAE